MATTTIETDGPTAVHDVTAAVESLLPDAHDGACLVHVPHTTAALVVNEAEDRLLEDLRELVASVVPDGTYAHDRIDDNGAAHLRASLLGPTEVLPVTGGHLELGTWQSVLLVECDGPRRRDVRVRAVDGP